MNWNQENMSTEEKFNLHDYRIALLEENAKELKADTNEIKNLLNKLDKRLTVMPGEFKCPIHEIKITEMDKRVSVMEVQTDRINKKIITWTAVASVILFLVSQVLVPYALNNYKISHTNHPTTDAVGVK
jgi:NifB/MoaA-like Fe-S oxidoreductase